MKNLLSSIGSIVLLLVLLALFLLGILFHTHNSDPVEVDLYVRTITAPVSYLVVAALALGALVGWLAALVPLCLLQARVASLRRRQSATEQELEALRALPFRDAE